MLHISIRTPWNAGVVHHLMFTWQLPQFLTKAQLFKELNRMMLAVPIRQFTKQSKLKLPNLFKETKPNVRFYPNSHTWLIGFVMQDMVCVSSFLFSSHAIIFKRIQPCPVELYQEVWFSPFLSSFLFPFLSGASFCFWYSTSETSLSKKSLAHIRFKSEYRLAFCHMGRVFGKGSQ